MKWRLNGLILFVLVLFGALFWNIYRLQIQEGSVYAARAQSLLHAGFLEPKRGSIFITDKYGNRIPAAIDREYPTIFAVPKDIEDAEGTASLLAPIVDVEEATLLRMFRKPNDEYELVRERVTNEMVQAVKDARLKGIYLGKMNARFYPFGPLLAHVLGFVGPAEDESVKGRYGLELLFDDTLRGTSADIESKRNKKPVDGEDIVLSIDRNIQTYAEETLERVVKEFNAESGTVIVEDPKTGKILAMGSFPDFDPNEYKKYRIGTFLNPAVQAIYEPGSIAKVLTMAAALDTGAVTPGTTFNDTGSLTLNQKTIRNWDKKAHGTVTMTEVIEQSINTGAAFAARALGNERFLNYLTALGVNEKTGIELPGEVRGSLKSLGVGAREIHFATASYGQGIAVTPIALASMVSAIANGGALMKPTMLAETKPVVVRQVFGAKSVREITQMMISAVRKAHIAHIPNYEIAGKTGTAQIPNFKKGGYSDEFVHTYAGFAPASDPRFLVLIKIDKPNAPLAGATVVPAFKELAQFILNYYNIPPDDLGEITSN